MISYMTSVPALLIHVIYSRKKKGKASMKNLKKFAALLMAVAMIFAMATTAVASDYKITVENSVSGQTYTAYKVFDATYQTVGEGDAAKTLVAYTIKDGDPWKELVSAEGSPFALQETIISGTYNVGLADNGGKDAVAQWFNQVTAPTDKGAIVVTGTGNGGTLTLDVGFAGYYYVKSSTGAVVSVDTANPTVNIIDKNQGPGNLEKTAEDTKAQIGDTVKYTITANVPAYDKETAIEQYTFVDTLDQGLSVPKAEGVNVKILTADGSVFTTLNNAVTVEGQKITVTYAPSKIANYPADATIEITYTATVNTNAAFENKNTVSHTWTGEQEGVTSTETVYTYGFNLEKVTGTDKTQLEGAKFELYTGTDVSNTDDSATLAANATPIKFNYAPGTQAAEGMAATAPKYTVDPNGTVTEIEVGKALIFGLDADVTYYLKETVAPAGYNMMTELVKVRVGQTDSFDANGINNAITQVENQAGTLLPSTGGIGTTLFYVLGGVLVVGALVLLITKKRMNSAD